MLKLHSRRAFIKSASSFGLGLTGALGLTAIDFIKNKKSASAYDYNYPLYRLFNGREHFYTIDVDEANNAINRLRYRYEGKAGYVFHPNAPTNPINAPNFYRLFNPRSGDHFYTSDWQESRDAIARSGYRDEGIACKLCPPNFTGATNERGVPFYRLYNPGSGDHFYTASASEAESAVRVSGYRKEGVVGYIAIY